MEKMKWNKSTNLFLLLLMTMILVLAGCGSTESSTKPKSEGTETNANKALTKITYAQLSPDLTDIHTEFAIEKGIYKRNGIDLKVLHFEGGGPEALAAVAGGDIQMGNFGTPILTGISKGVPMKVVASPAIVDNPFVLVGGKNVRKVADVKGKVLGTGKLGGGTYQATLKILEENGIDEKETDIRPVGGVDAFQLIKQGTVDAIVTTEPSVTRIERAGIGKSIVEAADLEVFQNYQHSFVFATNDIIKNNPDAVRAVLKGHKEAIAYAKSHPDELITYASKKLGYEEELVRDYYNKFFDTWVDDGSVNVEGTLKAFEVLKEVKEVDSDYDTNEKNWFDSRFLENK